MIPRHVLMTADAVGGVWTYALDLSQALARRGVRVTLAILGPPPDAAQKRAAEAVQGLELVETGLPLDWLADGPQPLEQAARSLRDLAAEKRTDLIHLNSPALMDAASWRAPVVGACHSCLATWWDTVRGGAMPEDFVWRTERLAQGYRHCDRLIAPSHAFAQQTAALYGVLPIAVRNGRQRRSPSLGRLRDRTVLTAGRLWDDGKNMTALDRAAGRMRGAVEAAGPLTGPHGQSVVLNHVKPLGVLTAEDLDARMRRAAVFCSPSLYEPFGLGVLEAAQAGCALVLADIPTFRELWHGAAVFFDPQDDAGLAATLDDLLDDTDRTRRMAALAASRAETFTVEAMAEGTLAVYAEALAAHAPLGEAAA